LWYISGTCHQVDVTHTHHVMTFDSKTQPSNVMLEAHQHPLYCHVVYVCSKTSVEVQLPILFPFFFYFFSLFSLSKYGSILSFILYIQFSFDSFNHYMFCFFFNLILIEFFFFNFILSFSLI